VTPIVAAQLGPAEIRFVLYLGAIVAATLGGYAGRRAGFLNPAWARPVMSTTIVVCDAPIAWLAIWHLVIPPGVWKVPVAGGVVAVVLCLAGLAVARLRRMPPADAAVFGLQAGMGNVGYTLGGGICFALWGIQGLALEQMYCLMWPFFAFLFCFPLARHWGEVAGGVPRHASGLAYAARTLGRSLTDVRSLPLYLATLGLALNLWGPGPPAAIQRWHVLDVLMTVGIVIQFGSIGMTVQGRRLAVFWKTALGSTALKLIVSPIVMVGVALALGLTDMPLYVCLILSAMPAAVYSVLMANLFGLNRDLANTTFILSHAVCLTAMVLVAVAWRAGGWTMPPALAH